jgi:hypothetical protein
MRHLNRNQNRDGMAEATPFHESLTFWQTPAIAWILRSTKDAGFRMTAFGDDALKAKLPLDELLSSET